MSFLLLIFTTAIVFGFFAFSVRRQINFARNLRQIMLMRFSSLMIEDADERQTRVESSQGVKS